MSVHCKGPDDVSAYCKGPDDKSAHCKGPDDVSAYCKGPEDGSEHCKGPDDESSHCKACTDPLHSTMTGQLCVACGGAPWDFLGLLQQHELSRHKQVLVLG